MVGFRDYSIASTDIFLPGVGAPAVMGGEHPDKVPGTVRAKGHVFHTLSQMWAMA